MTFRGPHARGSVLVGVLLCLVAATALFVAMLSRLSLHRQEVRQWERRIQTRWLAESALERAAARLAQDPEYRGETWNVAAEQWSGTHEGVARIVVTPSESSSVDAALEVIAEYAVDNVHHVRISKQIATNAHPKKER